MAARRLRAFAYLRVSTGEQTVEHQRRAIEEWAGRSGVEVVRWFEDAASGALPALRRPGLAALIAALDGPERPDVVVVYELSRLARSITELWRLIDEMEVKRGVPVVSVSPAEQALNVMDPAYRQFLRSVLAFVAQMEREMIRQRTRAAMAALRRDPPPELARRASELWRRGLGLRRIARELGVPVSQVRRALAAAGVLQVQEGTCPRCFARMEPGPATLAPGGVVRRWYCPHCGYETAAGTL